MGYPTFTGLEDREKQTNSLRCCHPPNCTTVAGPAPECTIGFIRGQRSPSRLHNYRSHRREFASRNRLIRWLSSRAFPKGAPLVLRRRLIREGLGNLFAQRMSVVLTEGADSDPNVTHVHSEVPSRMARLVIGAIGLSVSPGFLHPRPLRCCGLARS